MPVEVKKHEGETGLTVVFGFFFSKSKFTDISCSYADDRALNIKEVILIMGFSPLSLSFSEFDLLKSCLNLD